MNGVPLSAIITEALSGTAAFAALTTALMSRPCSSGPNERVRIMIYGRNMAIRIALFGIPTVAVVGLTLLVNSLNASAGIAFAVFAVLAAATGFAIGYFVDRLPGAERRKAQASHRHGT